MDYVKILNRVLPAEIRILAWTPVNDEFDARFSCLTRTYKYYFPLSGLDIEKMRLAASKLIGTHDFRNFCKVDVGNNVNHFIRKVISFDVGIIAPDGSAAANVVSNDKICEVTVSGMAFLWHQVRCMVSVLFLVGLGLEQPDIVDELLDVAKHPMRPQYTMASEIPLVLYNCQFADINWVYPNDSNEQLVSHFQQMWTNHATRASVISVMVERLSLVLDKDLSGNLIFPLMTGHRRKNYQRLLSRPVCDGIERHMEKQALKRKKLEERGKEKKKLKS